LGPGQKIFTLRSFLISLVLIPLNCYWIIQVEIVWYTGHPTCISLFQNPVFSLLLVTSVSLLLRRFKAFHLSEGELLFVYASVVMSSSVASHDLIQILVPTISHISWFATPENEWKDIFGEHIPKWLTVSDKKVLTDFYEGDSSLYNLEIIKKWLSPVMWWGLFVLALYWIMLCINVIFRKQWTENEKLAYPIIQVPLAIIQSEKSSIFKDRMLWIGFGIAAFINLLNGVAFLVPSVPMIPVKLHDVGKYFTEKPWNSIGWTPISFYPFSIALSFFMPLDLSFSTWFFYLFRKMQLISASAIGSSLGGVLSMTSIARFPYLSEQSAGAFMVLFGLAIYLARRHLWQVFKMKSEDSDEPFSYRFAMIGLVGGAIFLTIFCFKMGMSIWAIGLFFLLYYGISIAITRMRAELGPPTHELTGMNASQIMVNIFGSRRLGLGNLLPMSHYFWFFNRTYRNHAMPQQLECFKIAQRVGIHPKTVVYATLFGTIFGILSSFWAELHMLYRVPDAPGSGFSWESMNILTSRINFLKEPDIGAVNFMFIGAAFTTLLSIMRMKFLWWPFHPVGYAISMNFGVDYIWFTIFLGSVIKWSILKFGGLRALRRASPFFLGVIIGEYAIGSFWSALSVLLQRRMYAFWIF
jgi:hypothetical protein